MKAMVYEKYGPPEVLQFKEVEKPTPNDNEVLVRVQAAALNSYDRRMMEADPFIARFANGLFKPKHTIPGADIAGIVEAVGKNVTQFQPGDEVIGDLAPIWCRWVCRICCHPGRRIGDETGQLIV